MPLPIDLILVRHGESEGNIAVDASKQGDNSIFTDAFRNRHSRTFRLTNKGIQQAKSAGDWLRENIPFGFDRLYVSDYIRAKETAAYIQAQNPKMWNEKWREEFHLRERDRALIDNLPRSEERELFPREHAQYQFDPFLSVPAGGGESVASFALRLKAGVIEPLARQHSDHRVLVVSHGHVMRALELEIENLGHDDFIRLDSSKDPKDKIHNCQIIWYSRINRFNPSKIEDRVQTVRSVCPWKEDGDYGTRVIERRLLSNEELFAEVNRYPRHVGGE